MAKYLDENGAEQLNQLLAAKFDTKVDKVLNTKIYENILGTPSNTTWTQNTFYFASVKPTSFTDMWSIKYRISVWVESDSNFNAVSDCFFRGDQSGISAYSCFNNIHSTSYRPAYYHTMYRLLEEGFNEGYGHAIGVSLKDANSKDTTGKERTVKVELLEQINCTVTLLDTPLKWDSWPGGLDDTLYSGATGNPTSYNFSANGLQETGDANDNTIAYMIKNYYEKPIIGAGNIYRNNLCTYDTDWKIQGFVKSSSTGTSKQKNTATFRIGMPIFYLNSTSSQTVGSIVGDNLLCTQMQTVDFRYSSNCGATLVQNQPVFLVGVPDGDTFTLADTWWTQTLPSTEDGKIYIYLGNAYSTNKYSIAFQLYHPIYWYKNGAIRLYTDDTSYIKPTGGIPKTDLASDVQTSLGKADTALQSYTETDPTVPAAVKAITSTDISNWNAKGTYSKPSGGIPKTDLASAVQTSLGLADTALQSYTETDPTVPSHVKNITSTDINNWNAKGTGTITGVSVNGTSVATSGVANITSVPALILSGAIPSAVTATTQSASDNSTKIATTAFVQTAIDNLPEPMVFKGSLGTGGTITALPTNGTANIGDTYKVITAGTYASKAAKVGDTFICLTKTSSANTWELIPSGDEPVGTVTSVTIKATSPISIDSSAAITSSGTRTLSHANSGVTAGNYKSVTVNATGHITAGENPTTIAGFGITDAKITSGTITLGNNTITPLTSSSTLDATKLSGTIPSNCYTNTTYSAGTNINITNDTINTIGDTIKELSSNNITNLNCGWYYVDLLNPPAGVDLNTFILKTGVSINLFALFYGYIQIQILSSTKNNITTKYAIFYGLDYDTQTPVILQQNITTNALEKVESTGNKVTSISSSSTDTQYPSAKLVYNQLALKQNTLTQGTNITISGNTISATDTKNTAGSTDSSSKLFLIGATSQAINPQTYSDDEIYVQDGILNAQELTIGSRKNNTTIGTNSSTEGYNLEASGDFSHAEGKQTTASGFSAHAEGESTNASGAYSHAEGRYSNAQASHSHAEGFGTIAQGVYQHVQGIYNIAQGSDSVFNDSSYLHIIGNGSSASVRSNAYTLDKSGNGWFAGDVYTGSTSGTNKDAGSKKLATENYVGTTITNYKNVANGIAGLDSNSKISNSQIPTIATSAIVAMFE